MNDDGMVIKDGLGIDVDVGGIIRVACEYKIVAVGGDIGADGRKFLGGEDKIEIEKSSEMYEIRRNVR